MSSDWSSLDEPNRYALLVIDMQEYFRPMAQQLVPKLTETISACRKKKIPVIFTQHGHRHPKVDGGSLAWHYKPEDLVIFGSDGWKMMSELEILPDEILINEKRRYDAFYGTILGDILKQLNVNTVVISGVMTNLCCETTARSAFCRDFRVFFLSDGTACGPPGDKEAQLMHEGTLRNIAFGFGKVMSSDEYCKMIS